jgi:hypothetical protein
MDVACAYAFVGLLMFIAGSWRDIRKSPNLLADLALLFLAGWFMITWPAYAVALLDELAERY